MQKKADLWTKNFLLVLSTNFAVFWGFYMLLPTLPKYIVELGGNDTSVGLVVGIFTISAVFLRPWFGREMDKQGRKQIFIMGLIVFFISALLYNLAAAVWVLLALRVVHGIGWGACTTASGTVASDIIPASRRGEGMGYFGLSANLAMSVGPVVGILLMNKLGFSYVFSFSGVLALIAAILALLITYRPNNSRQSNSNRLVEPETIWPGLVMFFVSITYGGIVSFITLLGLEKGIENVGPFFTILAVVLMLTRPLSGIVSDRFGPGYVVLPGMTLLITGLILLSYTGSMPMLLLAGAFYGGGFGAVQPVLQTLMIDLVSPSKRGSANAAFFSALDLGVGIGSIVLGMIAQFANYAVMYRAASFFVIPATILYILRFQTFHQARMEAQD